MTVADDKTKDDILNTFGHDSNFGDNRAGCMYAEVGFSLQQRAAPPADILVSLSCGQVQAFQFAWPYGLKTGLTPDTTKKIVDIVRRTFGS
jgi:hypothetical protein